MTTMGAAGIVLKGASAQSSNLASLSLKEAGWQPYDPGEYRARDTLRPCRPRPTPILLRMALVSSPQREPRPHPVASDFSLSSC